MKNKLLTTSAVLTSIAGTVGVTIALAPLQPETVARYSAASLVVVAAAVGLFVIGLAVPKSN